MALWGVLWVWLVEGYEVVNCAPGLRVLLEDGFFAVVACSGYAAALVM